jgi:ABC-2 type transport system ATP-binding protein
VIETRELTKYYGERRAVGPLSFEIASGEIVGLLGLNGAGKTTTLRVLACDLLPSSGRVLVDGIDVVDRPHEVRARIGYLPDHPPLYDEMTVHEQLVFAAKLRGMTGAQADKRASAVEEQTQIAAVAHDLISTLSHGFRQRVGIAQAIVHEPRLLVLDEPISGLDPVQIVEMRELVRSLREKHTVIVSSHILSEISETCDRLLVIRSGEIVASGTESELSTRLLGGMRVLVTVRGDAAKARETIDKIAGVTHVESVAPTEAGASIATLNVESSKDVREELCRALVGAGVGLVEVARSERELESIFLKLAGDVASKEAS